LRISRRAIRDNAEGSRTGHESGRGNDSV
jgi:hypothetical protein